VSGPLERWNQAYLRKETNPMTSSCHDPMTLFSGEKQGRTGEQVARRARQQSLNRQRSFELVRLRGVTNVCRCLFPYTKFNHLFTCLTSTFAFAFHGSPVHLRRVRLCVDPCKVSFLSSKRRKNFLPLFVGTMQLMVTFAASLDNGRPRLPSPAGHHRERSYPLVSSPVSSFPS
jgi:hypothetical protein